MMGRGPSLVWPRHAHRLPNLKKVRDVCYPPKQPGVLPRETSVRNCRTIHARQGTRTFGLTCSGSLVKVYGVSRLRVTLLPNEWTYHFIILRQVAGAKQHHTQWNFSGVSRLLDFTTLCMRQFGPNYFHQPEENTDMIEAFWKSDRYNFCHAPIDYIRWTKKNLSTCYCATTSKKACRFLGNFTTFVKLCKNVHYNVDTRYRYLIVISPCHPPTLREWIALFLWILIGTL